MTITFTGDSDARGARGYTRLRKARRIDMPSVGDPRKSVHVHLLSQREGHNPPVVLQLTPEDAAKLGALLLTHEPLVQDLWTYIQGLPRNRRTEALQQRVRAYLAHTEEQL